MKDVGKLSIDLLGLKSTSAPTPVIDPSNVHIHPATRISYGNRILHIISRVLTPNREITHVTGAAVESRF